MIYIPESKRNNVDDIYVGDKVKVISDGAMYSGYESWFPRNNSKYRALWQLDDDNIIGKEFVILEKARHHERMQPMIYLIQCIDDGASEQVYLIERYGLELINRAGDVNQMISPFAAKYKRYLETIIGKNSDRIHTHSLSIDTGIPKEELDIMVKNFMEYAELEDVRQSVLDYRGDLRYYKAALYFYGNRFSMTAGVGRYETEVTYNIDINSQRIGGEEHIDWSGFSAWLDHKYVNDKVEVVEEEFNDMDIRFNGIL